MPWNLGVLSAVSLACRCLLALVDLLDFSTESLKRTGNNLDFAREVSGAVLEPLDGLGEGGVQVAHVVLQLLPNIVLGNRVGESPSSRVAAVLVCVTIRGIPFEQTLEIFNVLFHLQGCFLKQLTRLKLLGEGAVSQMFSAIVVAEMHDSRNGRYGTLWGLWDGLIGLISLKACVTVATLRHGVFDVWSL